VAPLLLWGVQEAGALGAAWALVAVAAVVLSANPLVTHRSLDLPASDLAAQIWRALAAVVVMSGAMPGVDAAWPDSAGLLATAALLACSIVAGATTYLMTPWLLWRLICRQDRPERTAIWLLQTSLGRGAAWLTPSRG
jgi:hypothetical protein